MFNLKSVSYQFNHKFTCISLRGPLNPNLTVLREVLATFAAFHPKIGYAQGMNDILARFLVVFDSEVILFKNTENSEIFQIKERMWQYQIYYIIMIGIHNFSRNFPAQNHIDLIPHFCLNVKKKEFYLQFII